MKPADARRMPRPFSSDGRRLVRKKATKGVRTTARPVRKAAFEAVVSAWPDDLERHAEAEQEAEHEAVPHAA